MSSKFQKLTLSTSALGSLFALLAFAAPSANATAYFVRTDGNDTSCNGKTNAAASAAPNCSFKTLSKTAGFVVAGDNVSIQPGSYAETVKFSKTGTSAAPILFNAAVGTVTIKGNVTMTGQYTTLSGVTISPPSAGGVYAVSIQGSYNTLHSCEITAYGATASQQATAIGLEGGSFNTVDACNIHDMNDIDAFHVWGHDHVISNNTVSKLQEVNYNLNHTDFIQSWGYSGAQAYNILVEGNLVINSTCQLGNTETDGESGLHDWTFRNNVFANIQNAFFWGIPKSKFYNNVFYNVGNAQGYALSLYDQTNYSSQGVEIVNNAFVANQGDVDFHSASVGELAAFSNNYYGTASGGTKSGQQGTAAINGGATKFTNVSTGDFHLTSGSVLQGKGKAISTVTTDKDGNTRGTSMDIGAYKMGATIPPAGLK